MTVQIESRAGHTELVDGESFDFGRAEGSGCITSTDRTVSEHHGTIQHDGESWSVTSTGSYLGLSVHDVATSASFDISPGVGPVVVPFAHGIVIVAGREARHALSVHGPVLELARHNQSSSGSTIPVIDRSGCMGRDGRALTWFQVLIALCEHALVNPGSAVGSVASDKEIRARLGIGASTLERALTRAREELGFAPHTPQLRVVMATTAVNQGVVTPADLDLL